ncbi:hypothetical protein IHE44_0014691 [Lamprotornis superbus]|uniref:Bromodomain adjacent to zinc finger domain 2B n=1 Tax=Lamprotornis superbus TaxID=245042 RepID=A0A835NHK2_9PASS|nr:hypothetical protein IHE44_0014691 [Lamprotornis superbus]
MQIPILEEWYVVSKYNQENNPTTPSSALSLSTTGNQLDKNYCRGPSVRRDVTLVYLPSDLINQVYMPGRWLNSSVTELTTLVIVSFVSFLIVKNGCNGFLTLLLETFLTCYFDMESGERLTSSSVSSAAAASTPASSTPSGASEVSKGGAATLSSTINTCEWWRTADTHSRPGAAFFPPLLGIPTLFAPPAQNHDSALFHSRATGKSSRSNTDKGINGSLNGSSTTTVPALSTSVLSTSIATSAGALKTAGAGGRKYNQEQSKVQLLDTRADKIKDKKPRKKAVESSSNSDSDSGSSSDTSSEGVSSSDSDDLEEDEEEEEDQSAEESEDDESDSENEAHHKNKNKTHSSFQSQQKQPQVLSQQLPFIFQSSQAKEESVNKHTSVIQSTGLVPNVKPLSLVHEAKKETYLKLIVPSPDLLKAGNKNTSEESLTLTSDVRSKREQYKQTFPAAQLKKQESSKSLKKVIAALSSPKPTSSSPAHQKLPSLENNHSNPFLTNALLGNHQPNGVVQSVIQEAPLALTTKAKPQSKINESGAISSSAPFSLPINLSAKSDSNSESDTEGSEEEDDEDDKDQDESDTDTEGEKTPLTLNKTSSSVKSSSIGLTAHSTPLNLQVAKTSSSAPAALCAESQPAVFLGTGASSLTPSISKRRRVADERELRVPLNYGYVTNGIMDISRDNFSFSAKIGVGDFYEARDGPQEEEVIPRIRAMEGRRGRPPNPDRQHCRDESRSRRRKGRPPSVGSGEFLDSADTKLLRKLQAQEIARQAAQIKLLRKLQKQEQARAAKEAKKQQAIMAAEEKRKQKEQIKIMKQQEKIKRIQQIRMEKELRAQQILEAKKKKKEEAANAKLLEAEKRIKEKEMRRQQAVLLKHQERERRRQHMMLMKAMEARKKAEEKERLKQEKRDEKRLNKERKLEQRRLELEMAKELKKPNEDMCLADQKPFPELPRIPGLILDGSTFSDCLMVVQFLRNFGKVLGFDVTVDVPSLSVLQEGLLNIGDSMGEVQDLLVKLVSAAVCDPGLGTGYKAKTILGEHLLNVGINRDNVSEILHIFMEAHCGQTELTESLKTKAFQAHSPAQKASVLAFLVNELACSKSVVKLELIKGCQFHIHCSPILQDKIPYSNHTDSNCQEAGRHKVHESQGDDGDQTASVEELEKQIEKLTKQQSQYRKKLFEASHCLRSMMFGQDRYRRRYWILPQCGGIFVEGMESGEGLEEIAKEKEKLKKEESMHIKEEEFETEEKLHCLATTHCEQKENLKEKDSTNLFLQKPGSFSKLSKLLEVAKMPPESDTMSPKPNGSAANGCTLSYPSNSKNSLCSLQPPASQSSIEKSDSNNLFSPSASGTGKFYSSPLIANDQLLKTLSEKSRQWFSLLPRVPCDDTSVTRVDTAATAAPLTPQSHPPSKSPSPVPSPLLGSTSAQSPMGLSPFALSPLQVTAEVAKPVDYPNPKPIPEVAIIDINENEDNQVTRDVVENWSVEEQAMEMDLAILQQVEDLERRVASASLQVKGWLCPEPASERDDLVYHEHKSITRLHKKHDGDCAGGGEGSASSLERRSDNPLDIAVTRLADLERNIERRYLKSPLSTTIQIKLDNVGTVTVPAPAPSISGDGDGTEEDIAPGLKVWRRALSEARSAAQYCQICRKGDNEELLLLCDGCDKGCHTYCHRPKISTIPDGDWFCPACIAKASGQTLKIKKLQIKGKKSNEQKRSRKLAGETEDEDSATTSVALKRGKTDPKKRKMDENICVSQLKQENCTAVKKPKRDGDSKDLAICRYPNLEAFSLDVRLVFDNCETFNEDDSDIGRAGHNMRKYFEKKWTEIFKECYFSLVRFRTMKGQASAVDQSVQSNNVL